MKVKLTKAVLDAIETPAKTTYIRDIDLPNFGVCVTPNGARSFFVERKVAGKTVRRSIGRVGVLTLTQARADARLLLAQLERGDIPPTKEAPTAPVVVHDLSLRALRDRYVAEREKADPPMKKRTKDSYIKLLDKYLPDWLDRPFPDITREMIAKRMQELSNREYSAGLAPPNGWRGGKTTANNTMRALRAMLNWAVENEAYLDADGEPLYQMTPLSILNKRRLWNRDHRRKTVVELCSLPNWWKMVNELSPEEWPGRAEVIRDYWKTLLFTGMRPEHAQRIKLDGWNCEHREITIEDPKNRDDFFILPVGDYLGSVLNERHKRSKEIGSPWLFPAPRSRNGFTTTGADMRRVLCFATGLKWTFTDLRRTFSREVDRLDISKYLTKRVIGHKFEEDVTSGYIIHEREHVRSVLQRVEDALLRAAIAQEGS